MDDTFSNIDPAEEKMMAEEALLDLPSKPLVQHVMESTDYKDADFVAASIIAARYDDPNVPYEIYKAIHGHR